MPTGNEVRDTVVRCAILMCIIGGMGLGTISELLSKLRAKEVEIHRYEQLIELHKDVNEVCVKWLYTSNLKEARNRMCKGTK